MAHGPYFANLPVTGGEGTSTLASATNANPVELTWSAPHGFTNGNSAILSGGTGSWAALNGTRVVTVTSSTKFTVAVNSTGFGAVTGTIVATGSPKRYVDQTSWDLAIDRSQVNWGGNVNGGGYTLSNVVIVSAPNLSGSGTLDFPSIPRGESTDLTLPALGTIAGQPVVLGAPGALEAGLTFCAWISTNGSITVRLTNVKADGTEVNPASATYTWVSGMVGTANGSASISTSGTPIPRGESADMLITATGMTVGRPVVVGAPDALEAGLSFVAWASATNQITVRITNNISTGVEVTPVLRTWTWVAF